MRFPHLPYIHIGGNPFQFLPTGQYRPPTRYGAVAMMPFHLNDDDMEDLFDEDYTPPMNDNEDEDEDEDEEHYQDHNFYSMLFNLLNRSGAPLQQPPRQPIYRGSAGQPIDLISDDEEVVIDDDDDGEIGFDFDEDDDNFFLPRASSRAPIVDRTTEIVDLTGDDVEISENNVNAVQRTNIDLSTDSNIENTEAGSSSSLSSEHITSNLLDEEEFYESPVIPRRRKRGIETQL